MSYARLGFCAAVLTNSNQSQFKNCCFTNQSYSQELTRLTYVYLLDFNQLASTIASCDCHTGNFFRSGHITKIMPSFLFFMNNYPDSPLYSVHSIDHPIFAASRFIFHFSFFPLWMIRSWGVLFSNADASSWPFINKCHLFGEGNVRNCPNLFMALVP